MIGFIDQSEVFDRGGEMRTIALRFADNFAPDIGTIKAHQNVLNDKGYVWYGKLGSKVAKSKLDIIMSNDNPRILLIHSGKIGRYWAYISDIQSTCSDYEGIPQYYREIKDNFHTWFKIIKIEKASSDIMSKCTVISSGAKLNHASHYSMSPYFFIEVPDDLLYEDDIKE